MMKSLSKVVTTAIALTAVVVGLAGRAEAALISVSPVSQTIATGGTANVDIVVSGLAAGETVGGFNFDLAWIDAILDATAVVVDPGVIMGAFPLDLSDPVLTDASGMHVEVFADLSLSEVALKAAQGSGFTLARISFLGVGEGVSPLTLSNVGGFLSNYAGTGLIPANAVNGSVCVDDPQTRAACDLAAVPEPASMLLLGSGLAGLVAARRRRARTEA